MQAIDPAVPTAGKLPRPKGRQLKLSERELRRLTQRITEDFSSAIADHRRRMNRFLRYLRVWRDPVGGPGGEHGASNFAVPLTVWQVFTKWAKVCDALLGDDAEIVATPTAPTDEKIVHKIGRYMTWRCFVSMQWAIELITFFFYQIMFGRAIAYAPYRYEEYEVPGEGRVVDYDAPDFRALWPDDIVVPAEDVKTIHGFSFVLRRYKATPEDLLDGDGKLYSGIEEDWEQIVRAARTSETRNWETDEITRLRDEFEGVARDNSQTCREVLEVWEWYGRWRMPKGRMDAREDNLDRREMRETELVVRYLPAIDKVIGVQRLDELYPRQRNRRPFVESSMVKDGSYWCPSFPELLGEIEMELSVNSNLATEAIERSVGPLIFYRPGTGFAPKVLIYEPHKMIPVDNPRDDVNVIYLKADLSGAVARQQELLAYAERVTGITDQNIGRAIDRPNAPRTARGQIALLEEGSVRVSFDTRTLREDLRLVLQHLWNIDSQYAAPEIFFRVTEEQARGLFDVSEGFGKLTERERGARFDFDLRFATSAHSKEARREREAQTLTALMTAPIVQTNPQAQWLILDDYLKAQGKSGMSKFMPKPAEIPLPIEAADEWTLALQGEEISVHPLDDDQRHIETHQQRLVEEQAKPADQRDTEAEMVMAAHILDHMESLQQKQQAQAQANALANALGLGAETGEPAPPAWQIPPQSEV